LSTVTINLASLGQARIVLGLLTICESINNLHMQLLPRLTQPGHPYVLFTVPAKARKDTYTHHTVYCPGG